MTKRKTTSLLPSRDSRMKSVRSRKARQVKFLKAFLTAGTVAGAVHLTKITRQTHQTWLETDPNYVARFSDARKELAERVEAEMWRRGVEGVEEPAFYKGERIGFVRKRSDQCLIHLAKVMLPATRRDRERTLLEQSEEMTVAQRERASQFTASELEEFNNAAQTCERLLRGDDDE